MKVFLSYSHADQAFAHGLRNSIEKLGVTVEDPDNAFGSGTAWAESIRGGLEQADVILLIVPEAGAKGANNAFFEAGAGHGGKRTPLVAAVSTNEGRSWSAPRTLEDRKDQEYAYTSLAFFEQRVLLSYYVAENSTGRISSRFRSLPLNWFYEAAPKD